MDIELLLDLDYTNNKRHSVLDYLPTLEEVEKEVKIMGDTQLLSLYSAVPIDIAKLLLVEKQTDYGYTLYKTDGILGKGMYFSEDIEYSKYIAKQKGLVVIGAKIQRDICLDTLNYKYRIIIDNIHKEMLNNAEKINADSLYKRVIKKSNKKVDMIKGIIISGNSIKDSMNQIILREIQSIVYCVLNEKSILSIFKP